MSPARARPMHRALLLLLTAGPCAGAHAEAPAQQTRTGLAPGLIQQQAVVEQPRPFGYVLGDLLEQRVLLQAAGRPFTPDAVPPLEKAGNWLTRRAVRLDAAREGRRWLHIEYQLVNAPEQLTLITLPALHLLSASTGTVLEVAAWPVSIAPLTPRRAFREGGLQELRADRIVAPPDTAAALRRLREWGIALIGMASLWLAVGLAQRARRHGAAPFAAAFRELHHQDPRSAAAWLALHRAFDRTAGRAIQLQSLEALFAAANHLQSQRAAIERFYALSNTRFFAGADAGAIDLRELCGQLRRIERKARQR